MNLMINQTTYTNYIIYLTAYKTCFSQPHEIPALPNPLWLIGPQEFIEFHWLGECFPPEMVSHKQNQTFYILFYSFNPRSDQTSSFSGNSDSNPSCELNSNSQVLSDLDMPIALRKGTRSCAKYPLSNFVSYHNLSPSFYAFTSQLSSVEIPKNV